VNYQPGRYDEKLQHPRPARAPVVLVCELRQGQRAWRTVRLDNLSESGFCTNWQPSFDVNREVWIRIPGLELLRANIRWRRERVMGCEFEARLYAPVFDHIVRQAAAQG